MRELGAKYSGMSWVYDHDQSIYLILSLEDAETVSSACYFRLCFASRNSIKSH